MPSLFVLRSGVTIGFEESLYTVEEPSSGTVALQVCLLVMEGSLGRSLQVVPEWREGTAQGMEIQRWRRLSRLLRILAMYSRFPLRSFPFTGNLWFVCAVYFNVYLWHAQTINFHERERETECSNTTEIDCSPSLFVELILLYHTLQMDKITIDRQETTDSLHKWRDPA